MLEDQQLFFLCILNPDVSIFALKVYLLTIKIFRWKSQHIRNWNSNFLASRAIKLEVCCEICESICIFIMDVIFKLSLSQALKRIIDRDGLSEERARQRIESQMSNQERVERSHVVMCTLWQPEYTQKQVRFVENMARLLFNDINETLSLTIIYVTSMRALTFYLLNGMGKLKQNLM